MATGWTLEGTNLRTLAYQIATIDGWDVYPEKRGKNVEIPYRDGEFSTPRKWFRASDIFLRLFLMDSAADGTRPLGAAAHLRQNLDTLKGLLYKRNGFLDLRQTVPDLLGGTVERQALVEVLDAIPILGRASGGEQSIREMVIRFRNPATFWRELPQNVQTEASVVVDSHGFNIVTGGNAPVRDFLITWTATAAIANARLEVDATGEFVQYSGALDVADVLVIDLAEKTGVINGTDKADAGLSFGHAWWLDLDPASTTAVTASVTSASDFDLELRWYDKWF